MSDTIAGIRIPDSAVARPPTLCSPQAPTCGLDLRLSTDIATTEVTTAHRRPTSNSASRKPSTTG